MEEVLPVVAWPGRSLSGKRTSQLMRDRYAAALQAYLADPNKCKNCSAPILPAQSDKLARAKAKQFCTSRCAAIYHQTGGPHRTYRRPRHCGSCGNEMQHELTGSFDRKYCKKCWAERQQELGNKTKSAAGRRAIAEHARRQMATIEKACCICGYNTHVEAAHLQSVASFPEMALVKEINAPDNLRYLCPNHHLEFDRGLISRYQIP